MKRDPIVDDVRIVRRAIAAEYDNNPVRYAKHLREIEKKYSTRLVSFGPRHVAQPAAVAEKRAPYGKSDS